jgi:hypothetical protein
VVFGFGVLPEVFGELGVLGPPEPDPPLCDWDWDVEPPGELGPVVSVLVAPEDPSDPGDPFWPSGLELVRVGEGFVPDAVALRPPEPPLAHAVAAIPTAPRTATAARACLRAGKRDKSGRIIGQSFTLGPYVP